MNGFTLLCRYLVLYTAKNKKMGLEFYSADPAIEALGREPCMLNTGQLAWSSSLSFRPRALPQR